MILDALWGCKIIHGLIEVSEGGLYNALLKGSGGERGRLLGFDIITCREVRLDAFLFGEESGRYVVSLPEDHDDLFLTKMDEARINCCFLGHVTKGRILIDDMDFGDITEYRKKPLQT